MPRVDFYVMDGDYESSGRLFVCRLTEKAYLNGHRVYVHTANRTESQMLDELLWTYRDGSFVPHEQLDEATRTSSQATPVTISHHAPPATESDLLIIAGDATTSDSERFTRVVEIVTGDSARRDAARQRFRHYRDNGFEIQTHEISG